LFGLAHALSFDDAWHVDFDWIALVLVTSVALILAYVAELTGSILMTILFHNIFNVIGHGWQMAAGR
jgi:membrane protease YdiL (CAAX protease family)